ncbi:hypothetical protein MNBD_UNCLBAC01-1652 [hydrothermal vent metagenome]|uniref:Uncharacterized protein n=1 Tax=hydrothermal vent metagenome TaxID=652676 RepID=A0A3B1DA64_9ZZZZ
MSKNKLLKIIFFIGRRTIVLYIVAFLLAGFLFDFSNAKNTVQLKILNRFRPESVMDLVNKEKLQDYVFYYQKVAEYIPNRADAYGLLGYCYYHLGQKQKAISAYEHAIKINPQFFWFHYNLSMIYFKDGEYQQAYEILKKTIKTKPQAVMAYIQWSKRIYLPIVLKKVEGGEYSVEQELKGAYQQCYKLLAMLQQYFFNRPEFKDIFDKMDIDLALF